MQPDGAQVVLKKVRTRFNVRLLDGHMDPWAELDCVLPRGVLVRDTIEYLYSQMDPKFDATNKEARETVVAKWGLYLSTQQNRHGIVMLPDRAVDSYLVSPEDWCMLKRRPKNKGDMLIQSHEKNVEAAKDAVFLQVTARAIRSLSKPLANILAHYSTTDTLCVCLCVV